MTTYVSSNSASTLSARTLVNNAKVIFDYYIVCQKQGADFTAAKQLSNGNTYSSTNADTDWASCNFSTLAWQGLGTITNSLQCKREGSDLLMRGRMTIGTTSGSEARIPLPLWNGSNLTSANSITTIELVGKMVRSTTSNTGIKDFVVLAVPSQQYLNLSYPEFTGTINPLVAQTGTTISGGTDLFSLTARIPIEGWQQSNIIIGQFNGLESCSSTLECTDTFSASVLSTGTVVSGSENVDWLDGNCTFGTGYTCNFKTGIFTATPNCSVTPSDTSGGFGLLNSSSATFVNPIFISRTDGGSANLQAPFRLICQKQGVDYVGKTAKAVASDQNVRTPGVTNAVIQSCHVSDSVISNACAGTCTIHKNFGNICSSATKTGTGAYTLNTTTDISNLNCKAVSKRSGSGCETATLTGTSVSVQCRDYGVPTATDAIFLFECHGVAP